jgi:hypothetical protein
VPYRLATPHRSAALAARFNSSITPGMAQFLTRVVDSSGPVTCGFSAMHYPHPWIFMGVWARTACAPTRMRTIEDKESRACSILLRLSGVPEHPVRFRVGFSSYLYGFYVVWWVQVI